MAEKKPKTRRRHAEPDALAPPSGDRVDEIYALMGRAEELYKRKLFRHAIAVCHRLAELDPSNMLPEQMIDGCRREILKRRAIFLGIVAVIVISSAAIVLAYASLARVRVLPAPGTLHLAERQTRAFRFRSVVGVEKQLEFAWSLRDAAGQPVPPVERATLRPDENAAWACYYTPPFDLVKAADGGQPVARKIVASGIAASGKEMLHAEWTILVDNASSSPTILAVEPPAPDTLAIVAGSGARTFRVEALDADGGKDLTYEWLVGRIAGNPPLIHRGTEATWTYRPPADALPEGTTGREPSFDPPLTVTCRVANRFGEPLPATIEWKIRLYRSNAPPQLIAFEPELSELSRIKAGEERTIKATVYDPDERESLSYRWELDGVLVSIRDSYTLRFPAASADAEKRVSLHFVATDACGAKVERTWHIIVAPASASAAPKPF